MQAPYWSSSALWQAEFRCWSRGISGLAPAVLVPLVVVAFGWGLEVAGVRSLRQAIPRLIGEANEILGAIVTSGDPAAR